MNFISLDIPTLSLESQEIFAHMMPNHVVSTIRPFKLFSTGRL